jgi:hypothetical protein
VTKCTRPGCEEEAVFQLFSDAKACRSCWDELTGTRGCEPFKSWANAHPKPPRIDWLSRYAAEAIAERRACKGCKRTGQTLCERLGAWWCIQCYGNDRITIAEPAKPAAPKDWRWQWSDQGNAAVYTHRETLRIASGGTCARVAELHAEAVDALTAERDALAAEVEQLKDGFSRHRRLFESQDAELRQLRQLRPLREMLAAMTQERDAANDWAGELFEEAREANAEQARRTIGAVVGLLARRVKDGGIDGWPLETDEPGRSIVEKAGM